MLALETDGFLWDKRKYEVNAVMRIKAIFFDKILVNGI